MRTPITLSFVAAALLLGLAAESRAEKLSPDSSVDQILDALNARGQGLKDFSADLKLSDADPDLGTATVRSGTIRFQNTPDGARVHVVFDSIQNGSQTRPEKIEYKLQDGILVDRNYRRKLENTHQVTRPGEKINLLKLGEGPFPLPIGQDKQEVHRQFEVKKIASQKDDPANTVHIQLTPKPDTRFARRFTSIDIWVETANNMPTRIGTLDKNGSSLRTTDLSNIQVNTGLKDSDFVLPAIDEKEWTMHNEAYTE